MLLLTDKIIKNNDSKIFITQSNFKVWHSKFWKRKLISIPIVALETARKNCKVGPFARRRIHQIISGIKYEFVVYHDRML